tara:strand:+ start:454 stop:1683 length:1230 start_codon:yes stop_codon:yes gene_type:complete
MTKLTLSRKHRGGSGNGNGRGRGRGALRRGRGGGKPQKGGQPPGPQAAPPYMPPPPPSAAPSAARGRFKAAGRASGKAAKALGKGVGRGGLAVGTGVGRGARASAAYMVEAAGGSEAGAAGYVFLIILGVVHVVAPIVWHLAESDDALELSDEGLNERTSEEMLTGVGSGAAATAAGGAVAAAGEGEELAEAVRMGIDELGFFEKFGFGGRMFQKFSTSMLFILLLTYFASGGLGMMMNGKMQKARGSGRPSFFNPATAPLVKVMVYWWVIYSAVMVGCFIFAIFIRLLAGASRADAYQYFKGNLWKPDQTELRRTCIDWGCGWIGPGRGYGEGSESGVADWPVNIAPTCSGVPLSMEAPILPAELVDSLPINGELYPDHTHVCQRPIARWNDGDEDEDEDEDERMELR